MPGKRALRHSIGRVLKAILSPQAVLGTVFVASLFAVNSEAISRVYHAWVTVLLFTMIMLVCARSGWKITA